MKATPLTAAIVTLSTILVALPAEARCKREPMPTVLPAIVVTEKGSYTLAQWEARQAKKTELAASAVTFAPVVVRPDYEISAQERREYAQHKAHASPTAQVSTAPGSPMRPSMISFLRRLFF